MIKWAAAEGDIHLFSNLSTPSEDPTPPNRRNKRGGGGGGANPGSPEWRSVQEYHQCMPWGGKEHNNFHDESIYHLLNREGSQLNDSVALCCHHERAPKASTMNTLPLVLPALRCALKICCGDRAGSCACMYAEILCRGSQARRFRWR